MARGRFISESVAKDLRLNSLSVEAQLVYLMTIPHLDRDGLIEGDTDILYGTVCPKRRQFIDLLGEFIAQWVHAGLVVAYDTDDGPVLWFKGFAKNQVGLRYDRETPSKFPPPPGHGRDANGLVAIVVPPDADSIRQESGKMTEVSGNSVAQWQGQVEVKDQVEVKVEAEGAAPPTAAAMSPEATVPIDPDVARVWEAWNANMPGTRSQVVTDGVNALLDDYSAAEIVEAIAIACRRQKRSLSYVQGILAKGVFAHTPQPYGGDYRPNGNGRASPVERTQAAANELRAMLIAQGKEHLL